jgi:hypothetical protein
VTIDHHNVDKVNGAWPLTFPRLYVIGCQIPRNVVLKLIDDDTTDELVILKQILRLPVSDLHGHPSRPQLHRRKK